MKIKSDLNLQSMPSTLLLYFILTFSKFLHLHWLNIAFDKIFSFQNFEVDLLFTNSNSTVAGVTSKGSFQRYIFYLNRL